MTEENVSKQDKALVDELDDVLGVKKPKFTYNKHGILVSYNPDNGFLRTSVTLPKDRNVSITINEMFYDKPFSIDTYKDSSSLRKTISLKKRDVTFEANDYAKFNKEHKITMMENSLRNERLFAKINTELNKEMDILIEPIREEMIEDIVNGKEEDKTFTYTNGFGGACPMQGWGYINGEEFYFRFRSNAASLRVGKDENPEQLTATIYDVYDETEDESAAYAGFINPDTEQDKLIEVFTTLVKNLKPVDEMTNPTSHMRLGQAVTEISLATMMARDINDPEIDEYINKLEDGKYKDHILASVAKARAKPNAS